jgi:hypothetical protein
MPNRLDEAVKHRAIDSLAAESHLTFDQVAQLYEREYARLELGAHVKKFLPVFTYRNVHEQLLLLHPS